MYSSANLLAINADFRRSSVVAVMVKTKDWRTFDIGKWDLGYSDMDTSVSSVMPDVSWFNFGIDEILSLFSMDRLFPGSGSRSRVAREGAVDTVEVAALRAEVAQLRAQLAGFSDTAEARHRQAPTPAPTRRPVQSTDTEEKDVGSGLFFWR